MSDPITVASAVRMSVPYLTRFLPGFDDTNRTAQAPGLGNHVAWTLGHLALTMHRVAERIDGNTELPASDFVTGDSTAGDRDHYDSESVCYGSVPMPEATRYPTMDRCRAIFEAAAERAASVAEAADETLLGDLTTWGGSEIGKGELLVRMSLHNATHAGQIIDLRRALGMPKVVG